MLLGLATKAVADYFAHNRLLTREREARAAAHQDRVLERRANFQRQTLLELQDAVMGLMRAKFAVRVADDTVRELADRLIALSAKLVCADSRESSERAFSEMTTIGSGLNERIGVVLRALDFQPPFPESSLS